MMPTDSIVDAMWEWDTEMEVRAEDVQAPVGCDDTAAE
jgi:hypothetical protein